MITESAAKPTMQLGDWVQARNEVANQEGGIRLAETGDVGHVVEVDGEWLTVFFERTELVSDCHESELLWLGGAETGKYPA